MFRKKTTPPPPRPEFPADWNNPRPGAWKAVLGLARCKRCGRIDPTTYTATELPGTEITLLLTCGHAYVWTIEANR